MVELLKKYTETYKHQATFDNLKAYCIENFKTYFGENTMLSNIRYVHLETYRNHVRNKFTRHKRLRADATINRELASLRHVSARPWNGT